MQFAPIRILPPPSAMTHTPLSFLGGFWGTFTRFLNHGPMFRFSDVDILSI